MLMMLPRGRSLPGSAAGGDSTGLGAVGSAAGLFCWAAWNAARAAARAASVLLIGACESVPLARVDTDKAWINEDVGEIGIALQIAAPSLRIGKRQRRW